MEKQEQTGDCPRELASRDCPRFAASAQAPEHAMPRWARGLQWVIVAVAVVIVGLGLRTVTLNDNLASRLASVYSLVHEGTWYLDRPPELPPNPFGTLDKVKVQGRIISSKPPVLPVLMTGEYALLRSTLGWDLQERSAWKRIIRVMALTFTVIPFVVLLIFFARTLDFFILSPDRKVALFAAMALGTQVIGFASCVNNHVPGAAVLMVALYYALGLGKERLALRPWRMAVFGLCAALAFAFDLPITIYVAFAGLYLLYCFPRSTLLWGGLGALPILVIHFGIMYNLTGSPLPVQLNKAAYLFESSLWRNPGGADALNEAKGTYFFHMTLGRHGVFLLFPVLVFALVALPRSIVSPTLPMRRWVWAGATAFAILTAYYVLKTNNYGGMAYGFRWYIGSMPVLLLMAAAGLQEWRGRWFWLLFIPLLAVSVYSAWECQQQPWSGNQEWTCRWLFGPSY
jgi:hypothetical protein